MPRIRRRVIWAPRAKRDLGDVWRYYARVASVEVADRLLREIDAAAQRLSEDAVRWRARDELMAGLRSALVPPYVIFYRTDDGIVRSFAYCTDAEILTPYFPKRNADGAGAAETPGCRYALPGYACFEQALVGFAAAQPTLRPWRRVRRD